MITNKLKMHKSVALFLSLLLVLLATGTSAQNYQVFSSNEQHYTPGNVFNPTFESAVNQSYDYREGYSGLYSDPTGHTTGGYGNTLGDKITGAEKPPGAVNLDQLIADAALSASTVFTKNGINVFDRGHQYLEGQFAGGRGDSPHGMSYHIAGQGQHGADATSIGPYDDGKKVGFHLEFIDNKVQLTEYQGDRRKGSPIPVLPQECPALYVYFKLSCSQKPEFLSGLSKSLAEASAPSIAADAYDDKDVKRVKHNILQDRAGG